MITKLKGVGINSTIAIIGSGPNANLFQEKEDISIALNGACQLNKNFTYALVADFNAPKRDWWDHLTKKSDQEITQLVSSYIAPFNKKLYTDKNIRKYLQNQLEKHIKNHEKEKYPYTGYFPNLYPKNPHLFFKYGGIGLDTLTKISRDQEKIYWGGTIAAIGLQVANIMGSKEINIYGCPFYNGTGINYFYSCKSEQSGKINNEQLQIMQFTINHLRKNNTKITIIGESRLI